MNDSKNTKGNSDRLVAPLKVAVCAAVLGVIVLAVEAPHSGTPVYVPTDVTSAPAPTSSTADTEYFPARFPPPTAEPEPATPTF